MLMSDQTFKPSQMAGTPTSARVKIFQDFQTMASHKDPVQAARATLHVAFAYAIGLGVKQNLLTFKTLVQKSANEGLPIAKAMRNLISNPHWLGENDFKDYYTSFIQKTLREFIVKPRLESTNEISYETLETASYNAAQATGSPPIPPPILAVFFNLTQEIPLTARINDKDPTTGETALATACKLGDCDAAQNLLNRGADPSIRANDGCLPLHWLFMFEREKVGLLAANLTQEWYSQHIDCKTFSPRILDAQFPLMLHGTPLAFAVTTCSEEAVQALLIQGADPTSGFEKRDPDWGDWSPLTIAACLHLDGIFNILWEATLRLHRRNLPHVTTLLSLPHAMSCASTVERLLIHGQRYQAATVNTAESLRVVQQNIELGPDIDVWAPLEAAVHVMDLAVAEVLVHVYFRYHQDARDQLFRICLELACRGTLDWSETLSILEFALAQECDINAVFRNGRAIDIVIAHQNEKVLHWLLKKRPDLNGLRNARSNLSFTPLYSMIENGFSKKVPIEVLLVGGADPNSLSPAGNETALHLAIRCEMLKEVEPLLAHQANPLVMNSEGITGFFAAVNSKNIRLVQLMLPSIRDINVLDRGKTSALSLAVGLDLPDIVALLLQNGAISESSDPTAVHTAASSGNLKSLEVLIRAGVDLNLEDKAESRDPDGRTPLHLAIRSSSRAPNNAYQCTMALLTAGADPNTENRDRDSVQTGNGDQVGDRVRTEFWPAHLIFRHFQGQQRLNLVTLLHQKGGKLDVLSNRGTTILHLAAYMGDVPMVHYLLQSGMSPALLGNHNQTPLHDCVRSEYALKYGGHPDVFLSNICQIATMLANAGAGLPFKPYLAQASRLEDEIKDEGESNNRYNGLPKLAKRIRDGWKKMQEDRAYRKRQEQEAFANKIEGYGVVLFRDDQHLTPLDLAASRGSDDIVLQCLLQIYRSSNRSATANQAVQSENKAWEEFVQSGWESAVRSFNWLAIRKFLTEEVSVDMNLLNWPAGLNLLQWAIERKDRCLLVLFTNELNSELPDHYPWPHIDISDDFGVELNYLWNKCLDSSLDFEKAPQNKGARSIFGGLPGLSSGQSMKEVRTHIERYHRKSNNRQYTGTSLLQEIGKFVCSMDLHTAVHYFGAKYIDRFIYLVGMSPISRAGAVQLTPHSAAPGYTSTSLGLIYDVWSDPNFDQARLSKLWQIRDSYEEMLALAKSPGFWVKGIVGQEPLIRSFDNHYAWLGDSIAHEDLKSRPFNFEITDDERTERLPLAQIPRNYV